MINNLSELLWHPGAVLIFIYLLSHLFKGSARKYLLISAPIISFILVLQIFNYKQIDFYYICGFLLVLLCGLVFAYTGHVRDKDNARLALLYFGAGISLLMSSNLFLIFTLFELMLIASTFMVFNGGNKLSFNAGAAYFKFHIFAGTLFLIGTITYYSVYGEVIIGAHNFLDFNGTANKLINYALLLSLLINIASPPFSYWLVEGYAATTPSGSVFLSVVTTKISLVVLMKLFLGLDMLIYIGIFLGIYGLIYASLESNMRRIINYGIISHIGIVLIAIGIGEKKVAEYMIATEIVYVALAMMCVSSVVLSLGVKRYFQIPPSTRFSPLLMVCSVVAFASISSVPFTPGYISKYLLYKSNFVEAHKWLGYVITFLTAGTAFAIGIKLPAFVLFKKFHHKPVESSGSHIMTKSHAFSLKILSFVVMVLGVFPEIVTGAKVEFFDSIFFNQISLILGVFVAFSLVGKFMIVRKKYTLLDFDWFFRYLLKNIYLYLRRVVVDCYDNINANQVPKIKLLFVNLTSQYFGSEGRFVSIKCQRNVVLMLLFLILVTLLSL